MENGYEKIIDFEKFCPNCKYREYPEEAMPCCECLDEPARKDGSFPVKYEPQDKREKNASVKRINNKIVKE